MRALILAVAVLMSAAASAQTQGLQKAPPPGQPTGPMVPQPAPSAPPMYDDGPDSSFRYEGTAVVVEREAILARLARMEEQLEKALERADRGPGRKALLKIDDEMDELRKVLNNAPDARRFRPRPQPQPQPPPPPPAPVVYPITEDQLQNLSKAIARESFGDGKLRVLQSAAANQYFLVPQVLKLLQRFTFSEDRLNATRVLWPRVLDRENAYQLYGAFNFSNEKDELRKIIGQ
jgi:hypothetical protein